MEDCGGSPIWDVDDLSQCFQRKYLGFVLPIAACGVSLFLVLAHVALYHIAEYRRKQYKQAPSDIVDVHADGADEGGYRDDGDEESDLMLNKVISRTADVVIEPDKPRGKIVLNTIEILALAGQVVTNGIAIAAVINDSHVQTTIITRLASWIYILALTVVRLASSASRCPSLPALWNHTTILYSVQWLLIVFPFRSVFIHQPRINTIPFFAVDFALSSILFLIAITTRKGEKTILVQHEDGLTPPKDQFASLFSLASFSWMDSFIGLGYKKSLDIKDVWNLKPESHATVVLASFRQYKKACTMAWNLIGYFDRDLLIQGLWAILASLFTFLPTWLLKFILEYVENPDDTPGSAAWLYVVLMFVCGAIQAVGDGQSLWLGRELSVKLRAIIVGELYAKALRRKAGAFVGSATKDEDEDKDKAKTSKKSKGKGEDAGKKKESDGQANLGKIINLMAIDSFKVSEICAYLHFLWASVPTQLVVAVYFLYQVMGVSSLAGVAMTILISPLNVYIASRFRAVQYKILAATDARIHATNEVLQNIRIIKYFAWEHRFESIIDEKRQIELRHIRARYLLWAWAVTLFYGTPLLTTLCTFYIFTTVENKKLIPSIAFPALSMFSLLRVPLDRLADMAAHVLEAKVSIDRVEEFLSEEETEKYQQLKECSTQAEPKICLENATLSWGSGKAEPSSVLSSTAPAFRLIDVNVNFQLGKLNIIAGPTGSGKTSLLMALLGEMSLVKGSVSLPGGTSDRADLHPDPMTSLTESVAYCAQEAWLVNNTIKENIIFASSYNENRYEAVIKACSLERDLEILDAGDQTLVGEKGISLSGGQKQRISLARAMYSSARHLLLDDCLSAVDSHTAKHIFNNAVLGPLMMNRTCILVTHNVSLVLPQAEYAVILKNGRVTAQGSPKDLIDAGAIEDDILQSGANSRGVSQLASRVPSNLEEVVDAQAKNAATTATNGGVKPLKKKKATAASPPSNEEVKVTGSVAMSTIYMYLRAMGPWYFWVLAMFFFFVHQLASLAPNVWIREWANAYEIRNSTQSTMATGFDIPSIKFANTAAMSLISQAPKDPQLSTSSRKYADIDESYYLWIYLVLAVAYVIITFFREWIFFLGSIHASKKTHGWLLRSVMHAKFKFFDSTPLGRIMNRFSKDIQSIDQDVAATAIGVIHCAAAIAMIVILISIITPKFLIAGFFITIMYIALGAFYINTSRDLKRLESIQRSPLYQQFGETLNGVVTIRAYGDGARFILDNHGLINTYNRPYIYLWAANRWLAFRIDIIGAFVSFFAATFLILSARTVDAGAAGLAMTYAITFSENILWLVRLYSENEQNMNSVERVEEYMKVEQEAPALIPEAKPAGIWPSRGAVKFVDYSTRYRSDLDRVLKGVSFEIQPGERVGIVGRTGAGKSSLALALFRGLEAEGGKILIDDVDIGLIGLQDLRQNITIVPQDPTLFTGTIRTNLDPFGLFTDEEIFTALRQVHLIGPAMTGPEETEHTSNTALEQHSESAPLLLEDDTTQDSNTLIGTANGSTTDTDPGAAHLQENKNIFLNLESAITESGSNLSQGQRQLLCLARALLKSPKVLLMDEATASIDYATDSKIQDTLRELRGNNTILTIAHRLQTIIDYDRVLVLDHGEVMEYDGPWQLINKEGGIFRSMCENSGNMEALLEAAKKAWEQHRLVDDS
ncbi:ATP-dependent bile acid permease [Arthroderma uncinatum]|uniref:ATP-dependent bile acid permease n=1 Tax=Arthroderma uncinatum TaxID=74035 RepID=UPI00144AC738|nr:ATP-dependent bile acid permease [Arthroderma uncinatum]KAF3479696.1 ATP-dependent bile acid permease [Arthroderma uncinatum]